MDFLMRSWSCSKKKKKMAKTKRGGKNIMNSVLDYVRYDQLCCYFQLRRINEEYLLRKTLDSCPVGRRKKERPR